MLFLLGAGVFFMLGSALGSGPVTSNAGPPISKEEKIANLKASKKAYENDNERLKEKWTEVNHRILNPGVVTKTMSVLTSGKSGESDEWHKTHLELIPLEIKISQNASELKKIDWEIDKLQDESKHSCFPKDTKVLMANGNLKSINEVSLDEYIMTYDIAKDTLSSSKINEIYISPNNHYYVLNDVIRATAYERFLTQNGWKKIRDIEISDMIFDGKSFTTVTSIQKVEDMLTVYNLNIDTNHNFFVSKDGEKPFLVHNSGGGGGGGK